MSIFKEISTPIKEIGNILDNLFTSKEEVLSKEILMMRLQQYLNEKQIEVNKIEAAHSSLFVSGWRPFIGWICGLGLLYEFLLKPILGTFDINIISINIEALHSLIVALLGMGALRTFEKIKRK